MHIETLSLISALQSLALAVMMWAGTRSRPGLAHTSLLLRAAALAVESLGWGALALQAWLTPAQMLLGGNAFNLIAQGMGVIALRMLLGESLRWRLVVAIGVLGYLGVAWFGLVEPDYRSRVLWGSLAIIANILLQVQALAAGRSRARTVLLVTCTMSALLVIWRCGQLWLGSSVLDGLTEPSAINYFYILLAGMQPLFASVAFLLLYNEILQSELHLLARVDPLTGVNNRLALTEAAGRLLRGAARRQGLLGVLMLDADHFKGVNDRFGHETGDNVLRKLVWHVHARLRAEDVIGRIGGEEFVVLVPDTTLKDALALGERIRATVECTPLLVDGQTLQLTVSIGVTVATPDEGDFAAVLRRADAALYAVKRAGRNRVMATAAGAACGPDAALTT